MIARRILRTALPALMGALIAAGTLAPIAAEAKGNGGAEQRKALQAELAKARAQDDSATTSFFGKLFGLEGKAEAVRTKNAKDTEDSRE